MAARWKVLAWLVWLALGVMAQSASGFGARAFAATMTAERSRAAAAFAQAEREDQAFAFERAAAGYEEALRIDPSLPTAARAEHRARALRERSEGSYEPLVQLERVRRSPALASDPRAIDALVDAAATFPPGLVRVEAWTLAAEAYAVRLGRVGAAVPLWRRVVQDPAADPVLVRSAMRALADRALAAGDDAEAEAVLGLVPAPDPALVLDVHRTIRRHRIHRASLAVITVTLLAAAIAIARQARRHQLARVIARMRGSIVVIVAYAAYVAIAGALLASGYAEGSARPFLWFGALLVPLLLLARAWSAASDASARARAGRAVVCGTSALATAFLVLEHIDVGYLEGLGL